MYAKLFASIYQGTLRGKSDCLLVFTNLLAHCDQDGVADIHPRAIAEEVGLTIERVKDALAELESPDDESRSPESEGRRILLLDEHRAWGWQVVNYAKYRAIRSEEDRREQNRLAQQRWRDRQRRLDPKAVSQTVSIVSKISRASDQSAQGEGEGEGEGRKKKKAPMPQKVAPADAGCGAAHGTAPPPAYLGDENAEVINGRHVVQLAKQWQLPAQWGKDAEALGWKPKSILHEAERFRQYWFSGKGSGTRRTVKGWRQCWSNWLANAERFGNGV